MTDRDRLIELISGLPFSAEYEKYNSLEFAEHLADYLLANGVIVPPCKVGQTAYVITVKRPCYACKMCTDFCHKDCPFDDKNNLVIKTAKVKGIKIAEINKVCLEIDSSKFCFSYEYTFWLDDIGKTVFLTKEEAEEKLKELNKNG